MIDSHCARLVVANSGLTFGRSMSFYFCIDFTRCKRNRVIDDYVYIGRSKDQSGVGLLDRVLSIYVMVLGVGSGSEFVPFSQY